MSLSSTVTLDKIVFPVFFTTMVYSTVSPSPSRPSPFSRTRTVLVASSDGSDPIGIMVGSFSSLVGSVGSSLMSVTVFPCANAKNETWLEIRPVAKSSISMTY